MTATGGEGQQHMETAAHGECWGEVASRSVMLGMHGRQGPGQYRRQGE